MRGETLIENDDWNTESDEDIADEGVMAQELANLLKGNIASAAVLNAAATCACTGPFCTCTPQTPPDRLLQNTWLQQHKATWPAAPDKETCIRLQKADRFIARVREACDKPHGQVQEAEFPDQQDWSAYVRLFGSKTKHFVKRQDMLFLRHIDSELSMMIRNEGDASERSDRLVVPPTMRARFLYYAHDKSGHWGQAKVLAQLRDCVYWPHMETNVTNWLAACAKCSLFKPRTTPPVELGTRPPPTSPWSRVHIDLTARMPRTDRGHVLILIIVDYFSKMLLARPLKSKEMAEVVPAVFDAIADHGRWPDAIYSDKGREFDNTEMQQRCRLYNTQLHLTTGYHPQSNGLAEKGVASFKQMLKTLVDLRAGDWDLYIPELQVLYNGSTNATTGIAPCFVAGGANPRAPARIAMERWTGILPNTAVCSRSDFATQMQAVRAKVYRKLLIAVNTHMDRLAPTRERAEFKVGQIVKRRLFTPTTVTMYDSILPRSMDARWKGPYIIEKIIEPARVAYVVRKLFPKSTDTEPATVIEHHCKLAPYYTAYDPATRSFTKEPRALPDVHDLSGPPLLTKDPNNSPIAAHDPDAGPTAQTESTLPDPPVDTSPASDGTPAHTGGTTPPQSRPATVDVPAVISRTEPPKSQPAQPVDKDAGVRRSSRQAKRPNRWGVALQRLSCALKGTAVKKATLPNKQ